ncbi:MAG TPA: UdgX family uracil-DNA binding protein [Caldimonas sp.]|nr:UdgX family uracil-DNA binding protein [Caldimonas sp.]HEV7577833.1 UdgX family uracil-DNA binding protein [Caldimonas sp.]
MTATAAAATPAPALRTVTLASAVDFAGFRRACRQLWAEQVAPERVAWHCADDAESDLFATDLQSSALAAGAASALPPVNAPAAFLPLGESVVLHRDPDRFGLLYRLLWRFQHEPGLRAEPLDPDWQRADEMAQAVRRDIHKMKTSVRFRALDDGAGGTPLQVTWFEPEHHIVEATAPFFARRFSAMRWALLTPDRSVRWDGERLFFGPGARRDQAPPADAADKAWLGYCESIFDPLAAAAGEGSTTMTARGPTDPKRRPATEPRPTPGREETPGGDSPRSLSALREALQRCRECPIGEHATQGVPGEGPKRARLMFVGEQPGDQEDLQGKPFVGPAGMLLARALDEIGVPRDEVYITNAVKHFKFELRGKRRIHKTPSQQEAAACLHWLESEIELVDPIALVALGATAARQLMGSAVSVTRERGRWLERSDGRKVLILLHPSALLRVDPEDKAAAYAAWLADLRHAAAHFAARGERR